MQASSIQAAPRGLRGRLVENAPMARYCSWRVGGAADLLFFPQDADDLAAFVSSMPETRLHFVGLGSNLLVRDAGVRGAVMRLAPGLGGLNLAGDNMVRAQAGVAMPKLSRFAASSGLGGAGFMAGIPGSVGGALSMNAGCFGSSVWDFVSSVELMDRQGGVHQLGPESFEVGYRSVEHGFGRQCCFVSATFKLPPKSPGEDDRDRKMMERREETQPIGTPNAGSVFVNPEGDSAGRLIESAGLAGAKVGGAQVSEKHCNFIVNNGTASAKDIEDLIGMVREKVIKASGVVLLPEVRIIGKES